LIGLVGCALDDPTEAAEPKRPAVWTSSASYTPERCDDSQRAITYYRRAYRAHRAVMGLPGPVPRVWYSRCKDVRRRAAEWRERAASERTILAEWSRTIGVIVRRLDRGLAGTPMAGLGAILEAEGRRHGISPFFMAAAAGTESSFGAAPCSNNHRNVWGLAACDGRWHVPYFDSWAEAIGFYARFLASGWQGHSTPYSFVGYAACDACWGRKTSAHMGRFGVGNSTRYSPA
jgi:hypothetical protein